jgi:hypothetical protein
VRGAGDGSAITETVSATLGVSSQRVPFAVSIRTCSSSRSISLLARQARLDP